MFDGFHNDGDQGKQRERERERERDRGREREGERERKRERERERERERGREWFDLAENEGSRNDGGDGVEEETSDWGASWKR